MYDIDILFVGGIYPKSLESTIIRKSRNNVQLAANNFQWDLIHALDEVLAKPLTILNEMFIGSYPKNYSDIYVKQFSFSHKDNANDISLGFINISILKHIIHPFKEKTYIRKWLKEHDRKAIFIYSLDVRFVRISKYIKKISPSTPIIISVMDLPEHIMKSKGSNFFVKTWKKHMTRKVYKGLENVDGCMVVAEKQIEKISKSYEDCVLIEAIANPNGREFVEFRETGKKRIVYAGTLAKQYNILNLIDAFKKISDTDVELVICGDGDAKEKIILESQTDDRICYLGVLRRNEVTKIMESAWVLVNPREKNQDFTSYSFPSKTIDYMLCGRPVVCQKLEAIPNEYDNHLIYFESSKDNSQLYEVLKDTLEMKISEINSIGLKNYEFAIKEKCGKTQSTKIMELIQSKFK